MAKNYKGMLPSGSDSVLVCSETADGNPAATLNQPVYGLDFESSHKIEITEDKNGNTSIISQSDVINNGTTEHFEGTTFQLPSGDFYHHAKNGGVNKNDNGGKHMIEEANSVKDACNLIKNQSNDRKFKITSPKM